MGTDQGKLGNMHALGIIADTTGVKMGEVGTTTFRPPYTPLTFGTIVGRNVVEYFDVFRRTPMNDWHIKNKAKFRLPATIPIGTAKSGYPNSFITWNAKNWRPRFTTSAKTNH